MNLNGLRVLNTRPKEQSLELEQALTRAGGVSVPLPTLAIEPKPLLWLSNVPPLSTVDHAIFISANAVNYFFKGLGMILPKKVEITCIGKACAESLKKWHVNHDHMPLVADSTHLLELSALQKVSGQTLLLIKGDNGRPLIEQTLLMRGAQVIPLAVYRRTLADHQPDFVRSLWQDEKVDMILITSSESLHNLFTLFGEEARPWLCKMPFIVISDRLAEVAHQAGIQHVWVSPYDALISSLQQFNLKK